MNRAEYCDSSLSKIVHLEKVLSHLFQYFRKSSSRKVEFLRDCKFDLSLVHLVENVMLHFIKAILVILQIQEVNIT